jgi:Glycosyl hydrolase family 76
VIRRPHAPLALAAASALLLANVLAPSRTVAFPIVAQGEDARPDYLAAAASVQATTRERLAVLGDAFTCPDARFAAYRRSDAEPEITDQWYVASQLWSDALLLQTPPPDFDVDNNRCYLDKGFIFLDRLWDYTGAGYFPRSNPVGTTVENAPRFADDNLIAGLALLATEPTTTDVAARARYVHAAQREADFLVQPGTGLWDDTFGGGFWWNTGRGDTEEGKPAQTNALAGLFFAELYDATGDGTYRDWSLRSLLWLDTILWDPSKQVYRWSVSYSDIPHRSGATIHARYFNYDQSIAIEAQLAAMLLDGDPGRLARAEAIGHAAQDAFWSSAVGGYNLEAGIDQVYASYGAWTSLGHLALYAIDGDPAWLALATANAAALTDHLREADGGYAYRDYRCADKRAKGCVAGPPTIVVDHTRDTSAQAWVQHLDTALAHAMVNVPATEASTAPSGR